MIPGLPLRPGARFVFVVGKGGVGKSTTAAALALSSADAGKPTRLLSIDPAHSIADLFRTELEAGVPTASPCTPLLVLEELHARHRADVWMRDARPDLARLVALATLLDEEDAAGLLELSLPGADEIMGAVRLAELAEEGDERVVVDTAPTGHMLRLLDSAQILDGWTRSLDAMVAKAGAVQEGLLRTREPFPAEAVLSELRGRVRSFRTGVLAEADFIVVSRPDAVVRTETRRLVERLGDRGLRIAAEVGVGVESPTGEASAPPIPLVPVPEAHGLVGCDGLRRWGRSSAARAPGGSRRRSLGAVQRPDPSTFLRDLLLFAGKGGVGKSTCAAACAVVLARSRRVLLVGADPAGSLEAVLGSEPAPRALFGNLEVLQVEAEVELDRFRVQHGDRIDEAFSRFGLASARMDREIVEALLAAPPPGMDEIFALEAILDPGDPDRVRVVDSAPTGHFLRLMEMPQLALDWVHALLRLMLKYRAAVGLDRPAEDLLQFAKRLRSLLRLLADPLRTGVVVVTQEEPVVMPETGRLMAVLRRSGLPLLAVLHNRWVDGPGPSAEARRRFATEASGALEIRAPRVIPPPVGPPALEAFFSQWELCS